MIAWLAPLEPTGHITCAASPISVTRPTVQNGKGSRSTIGYSNTRSAPRISDGQSIQPKRQSSKAGRKASAETSRDQSDRPQPSEASKASSAIQFIVTTPSASGAEIG